MLLVIVLLVLVLVLVAVAVAVVVDAVVVGDVVDVSSCRDIAIAIVAAIVLDVTVCIAASVYHSPCACCRSGYDSCCTPFCPKFDPSAVITY